MSPEAEATVDALLALAGMLKNRNLKKALTDCAGLVAAQAEGIAERDRLIEELRANLDAKTRGRKR